VWLIVPRPGRAAISTGSRSASAKSQTVKFSASGVCRPPTPSTITVLAGPLPLQAATAAAATMRLGSGTSPASCAAKWGETAGP
jgi:hypothetical protein